MELHQSLLVGFINIYLCGSLDQEFVFDYTVVYRQGGTQLELVTCSLHSYKIIEANNFRVQGRRFLNHPS